MNELVVADRASEWWIEGARCQFKFLVYFVDTRVTTP